MKEASFLVGYFYGFFSMVLLPLLIVKLNDSLDLPVYTNDVLKTIGALLVVFGGLLLASGIILFMRYGRGGSPLPFDPPNRLVTQGVFKYTRNPMFVASGLIWFGEFLFFGAILLLPYALGWVIFNHVHLVLKDEKWLEKRFGSEYLDYKKKTARYLPKLL